MAQDQSESFSTLISGALNDVRELFRQEIALAKYEVRQEIRKAVAALIALAAGAVVLLFAALFVLTGVARGFASLVNWPLWAGFFIVGGVLAIVGIVLLVSARSRIRTLNVVPPQTTQTVKEDVEWLKRQTKSVRE
jgi:uncharacterized membrane protein HdeD (DUF308 family)